MSIVSKSNFSEEYERDAVRLITERGYTVAVSLICSRSRRKNGKV
ncbi:hypothetical protein ACFVTJ_24615 [Agrobacterium sp. NPDC058088]